MNADRLLEVYERIADAPDAVARLRRFVLDLAVRGKLVLQDPQDEPASELLKRISNRKGGCSFAAQLRDELDIVEEICDKLPFDLPCAWEWVTLSDIAKKLTDGTHHSPENSPSGDIKYITAKNIKNDGVDLAGLTFIPKAIHDEIYLRCNPEKGDILYIKDGATTGTVTINNLDEPFSMLSSVALIKLHSDLYNRLIVIFLRSPYFHNQMRGFMKGAAIPRVTLKRMAPALLPLPPLAEQHRIVAKVDELMGLCDRLEATRTTREAARDRLAAATLARLNAPAPESFPGDARFALDALPALTARDDQIKQLRQTILNLAVRGKLVPQDPKDEPAPRFDGNLAAVLKLPFEVPPDWNWSRLNALGKLKGGGTPSKARSEFWDGAIPWVSPKDMKRDYITEAQLTITDKAVKESAVSMVGPDNILFVVRGMILAHSFPVAISRVALTINQDMKAIALKEPAIAEYLLRALKGLKPEMLSRVQRSSHGTCRLEGADYADFLVPIPPLAEQHRIVAKVDELMALCDRLEASLTTAASTRSKLLDALLAEALAPAADRILEAAE